MLVGAAKEVSAGAAGHEPSRIVTAASSRGSARRLFWVSSQAAVSGITSAFVAERQFQLDRPSSESTSASPANPIVSSARPRALPELVPSGHETNGDAVSRLARRSRRRFTLRSAHSMTGVGAARMLSRPVRAGPRRWGTELARAGARAESTSPSVVSERSARSGLGAVAEHRDRPRQSGRKSDARPAQL
jgi:hypothetical protein